MLHVFLKSCLIYLIVTNLLSGSNADTVDDFLKEIFTPTTTAKTTTTTIAGPRGQSLAELIAGLDKPKNQGNPKDIPQNPHQQEKPCDNGAGVCVKYYQCQDGEIITDGTGLIDIRFSEDSPCDYLQTCCRVGNVLEQPKTPPPLNQAGCGYRNVNGIGYKITGQSDGESEFGEFPHMVAILKEQVITGETYNLYQCGGSLIAPSVVLTAAHCVHQFVQEPQKLKIRAGEWDTQTSNEVLPHQDRNVYEVVVHQNFYKGGLYNDVGLLFLSEPVDLTADNVGIMCLPPQGQLFDYSRCFASGWGKDVFGKEGKYQVILKKIELPVVPSDQCQSALRTTRLGTRFNLHPSFICAGGEPGRDACKGDGGSPLICPTQQNPNRYFQAGIVAWGIGCGENGIPGVYANVAMLRNWIDEQLALRNYDRNYYQYS